MRDENVKQKNILGQSAVGKLLSWYSVSKRDLPWRHDITPYRTWISEIMLQQTRVEAVKPYFARFLQTYPDVSSLADANDETLLKLWEGLGYYSRARNLKKAACQIVSEYGGKMPSDPEKLCKLCGIGSYTAGAIASIAFGKRACAVDGNVLRVLTRLTGYDGDITISETKKWAERIAFDLCPESNPGEFTQALIELGATVCVPNGEAKCIACPLRKECFAFANDMTDRIPVRSQKKPRTIENRTILVLRDRERKCFFIRRRSEKGLLAGLYEFPGVDGTLSQNDVITEARKLGFEPFHARQMTPCVHIFTHKEWHMTGWLLDGYVGDDCVLIGANYEEMKANYAIPSAFSAFLKQIEEFS